MPIPQLNQKSFYTWLPTQWGGVLCGNTSCPHLYFAETQMLTAAGKKSAKKTKQICRHKNMFRLRFAVVDDCVKTTDTWSDDADHGSSITFCCFHPSCMDQRLWGRAWSGVCVRWRPRGRQDPGSAVRWMTDSEVTQFSSGFNVVAGRRKPFGTGTWIFGGFSSASVFRWAGIERIQSNVFITLIMFCLLLCKLWNKLLKASTWLFQYLEHCFNYGEISFACMQMRSLTYLCLTGWAGIDIRCDGWWAPAGRNCLSLFSSSSGFWLCGVVGCSQWHLFFQNE